MTNYSLRDLGWSAQYQSQLTDTELALPCARVHAVHRDSIEVWGPEGHRRIPHSAPDANADLTITVGDWLVLNPSRTLIHRTLDRLSLFKRKRAGTSRSVQLIAANVNTLLVVTSANQDFNVARLERYLALATDAGVTPLVFITKADLVDDVSPFIDEARRLLPGLLVEAVDARSADSFRNLSAWLGAGQTLALVGSSGVGKSTILNTLRGETLQATKAIREDDAKGRHTTTGRSMHRLHTGAWLIDTPGMRELQIVDAEDGISAVFSDIVEIASKCKFSDCSHNGEPGCAIQVALDEGTLDEHRLKRFGKLLREDRRNSETIAQAHERSRKFGRMAKQVFADKLKRREW